MIRVRIENGNSTAGKWSSANAAVSIDANGFHEVYFEGSDYPLLFEGQGVNFLSRAWPGVHTGATGYSFVRNTLSPGFSIKIDTSWDGELINWSA